MQIHVLRVSVTSCTHYGVKYLKDGGNSFARDSGQDAKEDCEIGFAAPGGSTLSWGKASRRGLWPRPTCPLTLCAAGPGRGAGARGRGKGAAEPLVLGAPRWDGPFDPRVASYPSGLGTSPEDQRGWAVMGIWCPWHAARVPGSPLRLSHPRSVPQGSSAFANTDSSLEGDTFLCRFWGPYTQERKFSRRPEINTQMVTNLLRICFLISLAGSNQFCKENVSFFQFELENTINIIFKTALRVKARTREGLPPLSPWSSSRQG